MFHFVPGFLCLLAASSTSVVSAQKVCTAVSSGEACLPKALTKFANADLPPPFFGDDDTCFSMFDGQKVYRHHNMWYPG